jgi:outer membrane protein assembly factor BamB
MIKAITLAILLFFQCTFLSAQHQWNQFRGPGGMGIALALDKSEYPVRFNQQENLLWSAEAGTGVSSPVIWDNMIFLTSHAGKVFETTAYDRANGDILWKKEAVADTVQRFHPISSAAAPTVVTDGKYVVSYFGSYGLLCYDFQGDLVWERKLPIEGNMYGVSVSPVIYKGKLVFSRDSDAMSYLELIDLDTGGTIWRTDRPNYNGNWSTPGFYSDEKGDQILVYGVFSMKGYDFDTGEELWTLPKLTDEPATTPLSSGGLIYVTTYNMKTNPEVIGPPTYDSLLAAYDLNKDDSLSFEEIKDNKSFLSRYDADGEGDHPIRGFFRGLDRDGNGKFGRDDWQKVINWIDSFDWNNALIAFKPPEGKDGMTEIIWQYEYGVPECPSPLIHNGLIYMVKNGGIFTCLDAKTGELKYEEKVEAGGPYYASPVLADGKIYLASGRGVVTVLKEGPVFEVLAVNDLKQRIQATPALVDGKIYIRTHEALYSFGL